MSLPHVILTVLSTRDATGYDITKEFSYSIGYFWKASHQQVYRELNKMAENNLVTCELQPQEGKPDRKVYSITDGGRSALGEWFEQPTAPTTIRDEFCAKLMACAIEPSDSFIDQVAQLIKEAEQLIQSYKEIEATQYANLSELSKQARLERLTLRRNLAMRQAWVVWANEVLEELKVMG
jgi:PadR family transcriptional regulator AphA